ncbi:hypothetical protein G7Z17_g9394 [Cylindrodendrum hubeiense]|uniref:2EXR domain-containing protein n=1 Tax=Cylindrodendrum hubeiense TaxID=595255 RepID=A0A9P5LDE3_9HYPO|nr:hypothetical protein G7Z17_g9394 [Cylindrodendrum hubeiense]
MSSDTHGADVPESPIHFHGFPKLPPELRWKIWQMAICTDQTPRIHYYSLFNDDNEGHRHSSLQEMMRTYSPAPRKPHPRGRNRKPKTIAPRRLQSQPSQYSWSKANSFLYLWDAGLYTACQESRAVLLQHLDKVTKRPPTKRCKMVAARHQGQEVYVRVRSRRDIICFRFSPEDMAECVSLRWGILMTRLPFFHLPRVPDINLALEFHDGWDEGLSMNRASMIECLSEPSDRGLAMRAYWAWRKGEIPRWTRMWLIDRGGRLPTDYQLSREDDGRDGHESVDTNNELPCELEKNHTFIDGKDRYAESYTWDGDRLGHTSPIHPRDVAVLSFIWKTKWLCLPTRCAAYHNIASLPAEAEQFFRVLRQLPDTDGTG